MVVLSTQVYEKLCSFISNYKGLAIGCEQDLKIAFPHIDPLTLSAVLSKESQKRIKKHHYVILRNAQSILKTFHTTSAKSPNDPHILLRISIAERFSPISLCRVLLAAEYADHSKPDLQKMLSHPRTIPDLHLGLNVMHCLYNENNDGPITDMIRRSIGEEYELRLKKMATDAGMVFHDEVYLRRHGYDKTPDLKLAVPCMYKGNVIHWIESKASFGDLDSHRRYVNEQLLSYGNRFGAGIVIYWFGYLDKLNDYKENSNIIFVSDEFPAKNSLVVLNGCNT